MSLRRLSRVALTTLLVFATCSSASANSYNVRACADAPAHVNNSWTPTNAAPTKLEVDSGCGLEPSQGLFVRDLLAVPDTPASSGAAWVFSAPPQTTISAVSYSRWLYKSPDDNWEPTIRVDDNAVDACRIIASSCSVGSEGGEQRALQDLRALTLELSVRCLASPSGHCGNGGTLHAVQAVLYGATVTLSDPSTPTLTNLNGSLLAGGYLTGSKSVTFDANDNTGIRTARLYVDGAAPQDTTYACDFTYAVPCSNKSNARIDLDTTTIADGSHTLRVAAVDPAGNETKSASQTIFVDNGAPAAPINLSVDGGTDWRSVNSFSASWTNATDAGSAVAVAHYALCASDGSGCQAPQQLAGSGISRIHSISVPSQGEWALRVWLEDAAGNVNAANFSAATLRYGTPPTTPARPEPPAASSPTPTNPPADSPLPDVTTTLTTPPAQRTTTLRQNLGLRLTSARLSHGRLYVRGRLTRATRTRLVLTVRTKAGRLVRHAFATTTRRFAVQLEVRDTRGRLTVRFAGDATFAPAKSVISPRS